MKELVLPTAAPLTSELVPDIALSFGQAAWVLEAAGYSAGAAGPTFRHYLKSLRKIGLPFGRGEPEADRGRLARYRFAQMMELALALHLRVYGVLPDPVAEGLIAWRGELARCFRQAYLEYGSGLGAPVEIFGPRRAHFVVSGVWLDLRLRHERGHCVGLGPPRLLAPFEALSTSVRTAATGPPSPPLNLSAIAIGVVRQALHCPPIRALHRTHG